MAGLMKDELHNEILTELSWIMNAIDTLSSRTGVETYEIVLIKYRVQPEEERAISKFLAFNLKNLNEFSIDDMRQQISTNFFEMTRKEWSLSDKVLKKLIKIRRDELEISQ